MIGGPRNGLRSWVCSVAYALGPTLAVIAVAVGGCDRSGSEREGATTTAARGEAGHEGHDHGKEASKGKQPEGEGHDHAHGEHADEVKLTPEGIRQNGIRIGTIKPQTLTATITVPARVAYDAERMAHVGAVLNGRVKELKVRLGDSVKKGADLVVIDSPALGEAQSEFLQRRTAAEVARPAVELAKSGYERAQQLLEKTQGISVTEVQNRLREYQAAQGELRSAETAFTAARNRLQLLGMTPEQIDTLAKSGIIDPTYVVRAPIDGRVIEREVTLGELVSPDKERLLTLADLGTVWVLADVPEARLGEIAQGAKAQLVVAALGDQPFEGTVSYISPELDPSTRTARVRVEVPNPEAKLRPGMFARAEITAGVAGGEPVLAVPEEAVQTVEGEPAVFVPVNGEPNTFAKREVGVGPPVGGMVPIFAGLKEGEKYVAAGSFILKAELGKAGAGHEH